MTIIALRGEKGSGKSTAAELLRECARGPVQVIGFADPIKEFCGHVFGFSHEALYGPSEAREVPITFEENARLAAYARAKRITIQLEMWGRALARDLTPALIPFWDWMSSISREGSYHDQITPRRVLQTFGTEFGRTHLGERFWIDLALSRHDRFEKLHPVKVGLTLISDMRFDNEHEAVKAHRCGNLVLEIRNAEARTVRTAGTHASEQGCTIPADFTIFNYPSRGLESLRQDLRRCTYL